MLRVVRPHMHIGKTLVTKIILGYASAVAIRFTISIAFFGQFRMGEVTFNHVEDAPFPNQQMDSEVATLIEVGVSIITQALPIIPIIVSSAITLRYISLSSKARSNKVTPQRRKSETQRRTTVRKRASKTVAIFTLAYVTCHLPIFLSALRMTGIILTHHDFVPCGWFSEYYMYTFTIITLFQTNALANPCIYYLRMSSYRTNTRKVLARIRSTMPVPGGRPRSDQSTVVDLAKDESCMAATNSTRRTVETGGV
eukprot:sb/3468643/